MNGCISELPRSVGGTQLFQLLEARQPVEGELVEAVGPAGLGVPQRVLDEVALPARLAVAAAAAAEREEHAALRQDRLDEGGEVGLSDRVVVPSTRI